MNILIVKTSSMGDLIHTLPAAQAIRAAHPDAKIGWAAERAHAAVLERQPWLDETVIWNRGSWRAFADFIRRLRATSWDVAIDFQGLFRSGLITRLSGASRRIGYAPTRERAHWFYTERVPLATLERHAVERSLDLAARLGAKVEGLAIDRPYLEGGVGGLARSRPAGGTYFPLHPSRQDREAVEGWLCEQGFDPRRQRLVILNPHCRKDANRWPVERFAALARRLVAQPGIRVALSGGPVAKELCDEIAALAPQVLRADGRFSLLGSAALFAQSAAVVTGDTGPMHIAAAVDTPIVALFGPANPLRTGPYASDAIVLREPLECSPCYARTCPLGFDPPLCMDLITIDRVLLAVHLQLQRRADSLRRCA